MGQIKFIGGLILTSLFTLAIVVFATQFGAENGASVLLSEDAAYDDIQTDMVGGIQDFNDNANTSIDTLMSTTQDAGDQSATSGGQFKVGAASAIGLVITSITVGFEKIFGADNSFGIFLTALTSVLVWIIGLYAWKTWKGNPD